MLDIDYIIGFSLLIFIIVIVFTLIKHFLLVQIFDGKIIDKQKETWKSMSVSSKVTSYSLIIQTNDFDRVSLIVLNPKKFEDLVVGDFGTIKVRGNFLIHFSKASD